MITRTARRRVWLSIVGVLICLALFAPPAAAKSGNVLPPTAEFKGYSLTEAAAATAFFNSGARPQSELPAGLPFQILYTEGDATTNTFYVAPGTAFYVPVVWDPGPQDAANRQAVQDLYFDPAQYGAEYIRITIDGVVVNLGPAYAAGLEAPGLRPGLDSYSAVAAFLTPLPPGTHTIILTSRFSGALLGGEVIEFTSTYTVHVG